MVKLRIKARAIDMLGRQQIAGIPTAIHELFKNAHDAYAETVSVDYFRSDALFVLRDDGIGMTDQEFEQRWLTIGTDSKVEQGTLPLPVPDGVTTLRPVLGEKGVGRLAIATIGPLVLVLTRSRRGGSTVGVTGALVHWAFFRIPGLDVDRVDIPVMPLRPDEKPDNVLIDLLKERVLANVAALRGETSDTALDAIAADVAGFELDLDALYDEIKGSRLGSEGDQGTHFFVRPADRIIERDIDDTADYVASSLTKSLLGFANTMVPNAPKPPILASFTDHRLDGTSEELIGTRSFFTPEEFTQADHHISGGFDAFGQFFGKVSIYGNSAVPFHCAWSDTTGRPTDCGPFKLNFAYIQGLARESLLDPEEWARMTNKLNRIGGLYLYRDGVRILPYGNSDYDFLDVERRRSKSAGHYFFSFRRMFGAIETTRGANSGLVEKAGREGFQQNRAYRQFKEMLENLLVQLAADFFREGGLQADPFLKVKAEAERNEEIRRRRERHAKAKRSAFALELETFFEEVGANTPVREAEKLREEAAKRLLSAASARDGERAAAELLRVTGDIRHALRSLEERFRIRKPQGLGLTKPLLRDWATYRDHSERLAKEVFVPLAAQVEETLAEVVERFAVPLDRRRRFDEATSDVASQATAQLSALVRATTSEAAKTREAVGQRTQKAAGTLDAVIRQVASEFASTDVSGMTTQELTVLADYLHGRMTKVLEAEVTMLSGIRDRLAAVLATEDGTGEELTEALEEQVESLRDEMEVYIELAQLGMAVGVVHHDFGEAIKTIRRNIRALQAWAKMNPDLNELYISIRTAFEHLDGYLTLFTPLNRRLYRSKITIRGENVAMFLDGLFAERFKESGIRLVATDAFRAHEIDGYPSTFYPVFVNLVENARHWVEDSGAKTGRIVLDVDDGDIIVSDTGPGVPQRDRDVIFEYGFTRKKTGGQGLGLFISRQVLKRADWKLELDPPAAGTGATFRMIPPAGPDPDGDATGSAQ